MPLRSEVKGRDDRLFVSLPENYTADETARYPVLYVLDGNDSFPLAVEAHRLLPFFDEVPEVIIVGVGYPARFLHGPVRPRWTDYTPSRGRLCGSSTGRAEAPIEPAFRDPEWRSSRRTPKQDAGQLFQRSANGDRRDERKTPHPGTSAAARLREPTIALAGSVLCHSSPGRA